jgi:DNA-binding NtrC family response regulator
MQLLGDRFLHANECWFDIATGDRVAVSIAPAGSVRSQIDWAERCAMLLRLRHPLLNPLIDYGVADRCSLFEAYSAGHAITVSRASGVRLVAHARRFLDAHGIALRAADLEGAVRRVQVVTRARRHRPLGVVLQPRRAESTLTDLLSAQLPGGVTAVRIVGRPGSGLRTLAMIAARTARLEGYVPVCPAAIQRWPGLVEMLHCRHVCVLTHEAPSHGEQASVAEFLACAGLHSARAHIRLTLHRDHPAADSAIHLDALGITSITTMTYIDPELGPSHEEILHAARRAHGMPGRFLSELGGFGDPPAARPYWAVHETRPSYDAEPPPPSRVCRPAPTMARLGSVVARARARASVLGQRGRHATASRLLARAARVLGARGQPSQAAECWLQLAWMARTRGVLDAALRSAEQGRLADPGAENRIRASRLTAVCWTDDGRFIEAEAALRTLCAAAADVNAGLGRRCALSLARVVLWQGRHHEVPQIVEPMIGSNEPDVACEALLLTSRALGASRNTAAALQAARDASRRAAEPGDLRLQIAAARAMAQALCDVGDVDGVRAHVGDGIRLAAGAHLPLASLKLRAVLLRAVLLAGEPPDVVRRARVPLERALSRRLPAIVRREIESALETGRSADERAHPGSDPILGHLESFLELAQTQENDSAAIAQLAEAVCERTGAAAGAVFAADGRVIASAGKGWRERSTAAAQALGSGRTAVRLGGAVREIAEPVRCGRDLAAAIACRWSLGATCVPSVATAVLRAAAMAIGTHLRAVLDTPAAEPAPGIWSDLLGESAGAVALRAAIQRASRAPFPVLVEGESGSGKELVARAIHRLSPRHTRRFCAINCAALSDELVEAELFGHARGAFTGAVTERAGLFEEADGGTLFLDEVGELSARAQAKLLRVLQEGEVRRVGENIPRRVDVRIVAATNRRLEQEAATGRFRTDLRFRLDVLRIVVPPLRDRAGDVPILAQHFWRQAADRVGSHATLGPDALAALARHDWPGNVRELQNAIAWLAVHAPRRGRVSSAMLPAQFASNPIATGSFEAAREEFERRFIRAALAQAGGQRLAAARALGVSRQGLAKMLKRLGIEEER